MAMSGSERTRRCLEKRLAAMSLAELTDYRRRRWEYEKRRLTDPNARMARRASANRYRREKYERVALYQKNYKIALKAEMLAAYGQFCACCGEDESVFLTLDHIEGKGAAHRKAIKRAGGYAMYLYLKQQGWPEGFQVLCYNCNFVKGTGTTCPHVKHIKEKTHMNSLRLVNASPPDNARDIAF